MVEIEKLNVPWLSVIGWCLVLLLGIIAYFIKAAHSDLKTNDKIFDMRLEKIADTFFNKIKEVAEHFAKNLDGVKVTVENLGKEMNSLAAIIKEEAAIRRGETKRIDELHNEIHVGKDCVRTRLHDLENFQTGYEAKEELMKRIERGPKHGAKKTS